MLLAASFEASWVVSKPEKMPLSMETLAAPRGFLGAGCCEVELVVDVVVVVEEEGGFVVEVVANSGLMQAAAGAT